MRPLLCALIVLLFAASSPVAAEDAYRATYSVKGKYEEIKENLVFAITNRGLVVNNTAHVAQMLERTGRDLGGAKPVYLQGEVLEFCSAALSREMMEADPHFIVLCPYTIAVYVLPGEPDRVYLSYRKPAVAAAVLGKVNQLLEDIVREALQP